MRLTTALFTAAFTAAFAATAFAGNDGWYFSAGAGLNMAPETTLKAGNGTYKSDQNAGFGLEGEVGYGFGNFRIGEEVGWLYNGVDTVKSAAGSSGGNGSLQAVPLMTNLHYDIPTGTRWIPTVGVGVGYVDVIADSIRGNGAGGISGNGWAPAAQGLLGLGYRVDDNLTIGADYRYLQTAEASIGESAALGGGNAKVGYQSHEVLVGFTYRFGAPPPPPPPVAAAAPAPAPTPKPAPAPVVEVPRNYLVFFDFDKSTVTPEARKIVAQAAANAKKLGVTRIALTGHTDRAGSDAYNMALSLRRAEAVKAVLVSLGVPAGEISVVGKGESEPLVPTPDGVREPKNRRVEIVLPQ